MTEKSNTKANFGLVGWQLIIFAAVGLMVTGSFWASAATNVVAIQVQQLLGLDSPAQVLFTNTYVALATVAIAFVLAIIHSKVKARIMIPVEFFILALGLIFMGRVSSMGMYFVSYLCVYSMAQLIAQVGFGIVFGNYMPTKKGIALGWATVGASLNSIVSLPLLNALTGAKGFGFACAIFALIMVVLGVIHLILWPDDPKKRNYLPDNGDISEEQLKEMELAQQNMVKNWTFSEVFKNKNFWCISFGYGMIFLCTVGIASQLVPHLVMNGVPQPRAIGIMSITAIVGIFSSIASGYIDQKFGVKVMAALMAGSYTLSCLFAGFFPFTPVTTVLFIAFYCLVVGAISNLPMSHGIGVYGVDFKRVWRAIIPIIQAIAAFSGLLLGKIRELTGGYGQAYRVLMVCAIVALILFLISDSKVMKKPGEKPVGIKIKG